MCTDRTLCRNECKGQGTFSVIKVDDLVRKQLKALEKGVGDDEKRMIILKLFERITVSRGTEEYDIKYTMRSDYEDFV